MGGKIFSVAPDDMRGYNYMELNFLYITSSTLQINIVTDVVWCTISFFL